MFCYKNSMNKISNTFFIIDTYNLYISNKKWWSITIEYRLYRYSYIGIIIILVNKKGSIGIDKTTIMRKII